MKTQIKLSILLVIFGLFSCETEDSLDKKESYLDYLSDKTIIGIYIQGDTKYIFTSQYCNTCYVAPEMSFIPTNEEWTVVNDSTYHNYSPTEFSGLPISDNSGNFYTAKENIVYKLNDVGEKEFLLSTGDFDFTYLTFDTEDNFWFYGNDNGIAFWNKSVFTIYNTQNSQLPTNIVHGLGVDKSGIVWVSLDFQGLLKIQNDNWIVIPNAEIPGLTEYSYLRGPKIIQENSVWFEVFSSDTTSNILRFDNDNWKYEFPDNTIYCDLEVDSRGTIWSINNHYDYSDFKYSSLKYFHNNTWIDFNISDIDTKVLTVNADDRTVYIGTLKGLIEKPR